MKFSGSRFPGLLLTVALASTISATSAAAPAAAAPVWKSESGLTVEGQLAGVYGPFVAVKTKNGRWLERLDRLDAESLGRVLDHLNSPSIGKATDWSESTSTMAKALRKKLVVWDGRKFVDFESAGKPEPEIYLVYFGAKWCPPCRAFTPGFVETYRKLKADPAVAARFEVVFVSSDRDAGEQADYVRTAGMPWPAITYSQVGRVPVVDRTAGKGIPCLVVMTREGDVLFHTYTASNEYLGPDEPLKSAMALLPLLDPESPDTKLARFPLDVVAHVRASKGTRVQPKRVAASLNMRAYHGLEPRTFVARITIDERGRVTAAETEPVLDVVYRSQFSEDVSKWLFLPQAEDGVAKTCQVRVPITVAGSP